MFQNIIKIEFYLFFLDPNKMKTILIVLICLILIFKIYYAITTRYFKNSQLIINNSKTNLIFLKKRSFLFKFFIANNVDQLTLITNDSSVNFFVLADSGGRPVIYRTLTGQFTANQMGRLGPMYNTKFQLNIGDNFYCKKIYLILKLIILS